MPSRNNPPVVRPRRLTQAQINFVDAYFLTGRNASEAYRQAYPCSRNWTVAALNVQASRSLDNPRIALAIQERSQSLAERSEIDRDWLIRKLRQEAEARRPLDFADSARIAALKEIGDLLGYHVTKTQGQVEHRVVVEIVRLPAGLPAIALAKAGLPAEASAQAGELPAGAVRVLKPDYAKAPSGKEGRDADAT